MNTSSWAPGHTNLICTVFEWVDTTKHMHPVQDVDMEEEGGWIVGA